MSAIPRLDDARCVRRAQAGDHSAFETLFRRHSGRIFRICRTYTDSDAEAEDLVQEAFVQAWCALDRLDQPGAFPGWLSTIARNRARDHAMGRARHAAVVRVAPVATGGGDLETRALRREARTLTGELIERMPDGTPRRAAMLFYLEDREVADVARDLDTSVTNVTSALSRARAWLRRHVLAELNELRGYRP